MTNKTYLPRKVYFHISIKKKLYTRVVVQTRDHILKEFKPRYTWNNLLLVRMFIQGNNK